MRGREFRAAAVVAAALALAAFMVAWEFHLPVRDPDGVSIPTWVRLPAIVLGAVALDVLMRWVVLVRSSGLSARDTLRTVLQGRWDREQITFTLTGLVAWYVAYVAFRNLKSYVPFVTDGIRDRELARLDEVLWLGHDPAEVLHQVLGTGWAAWLFSSVYVVWIGLVPATLAIALVWTRRSTSGAWYVTAVSMNWLIGAAVYYLVPTLGPIYSSPQTFADLPRTYNTSIQEWLLSDRAEVLAGPWDTTAVQTIAGFASLHVAVMITICLVVQSLGMPLVLRVAAWTFALLTAVATVYLGWHHFVDVVAGVAIGVVSTAVAGQATGYAVRRRERAPATGVPAPAGSLANESAG